MPSPGDGAAVPVTGNRTVLVLWVSRPRFWLYLAGPFLVGYAAGASGPTAFVAVQFWLPLVALTLPANLFVYGVNDLADGDTDAHNAKKGVREVRLRTSDRGFLTLAVVVAGFLALGLMAPVKAPAIWYGVTCLVLAAAYSLPPIRLKARVGFDAAANGLYALPGFMGFSAATGVAPPAWVVAGAWAWTAAMHTFSAVPDISADRAVGVQTTAVRLGAHRALVLCASLWSVAAAAYTFGLSPAVPGWPVLVVGAWLYPALAAALVFAKDRVIRVYWFFPLFNALTGGALFTAAIARW